MKRKWISAAAGVSPLLRPLILLACAALLTAAGCDGAPDRREVVLTKEGPRHRADAARQRIADKALKIVVLRAALSDQQLDELKAVAPGTTMVVVHGKDPFAEQMREIADADVLMTDWLNRDLVRAGKNLKWIQHYAAGVDDLLFPELVESPVILTNTKIIQGPQIADHGMAMLLALTRRLNEIILQRPESSSQFGHYRRRENWPIELDGRTALIIGVGGIGMQIAQRAHAFGMHVIGMDPKDIPNVRFIDSLHKPDELRELLPLADVVFVAAPLTAETKGMLGEAEFRLMKRDGYFIALGRAGTYDAEALLKVLQERHLAGAGLDVTDPVPLPPDHPLRKLDNVIITPHMAGQSDKIWDRRFALMKDNLDRFVRGLPLRNVVDKRKGY